VYKKTSQRIVKKIEWLSRHFENITHIPLKGIFEGIYKLRVGAWRILYGIDYGKETIFIYRIGHRKEVYK
jgi:mRNA interferase RelE/StbE